MEQEEMAQRLVVALIDRIGIMDLYERRGDQKGIQGIAREIDGILHAGLALDLDISTMYRDAQASAQGVASDQHAELRHRMQAEARERMQRFSRDTIRIR